MSDSGSSLDSFGGLAGDGTNTWGGGSDSSGSGLFGSGISGGSLGSLVSGIGGLFGGMQDSKAYEQEAQSYDTAAAIAGENVNLEEEATRTKQFEANRKLLQTEGTQRAGIAANGFEEGGSGMYILADSARQGALEQGMIGVQGEIQANSYREQQQMAKGEAEAARAAAQKAKSGGIFSAIGGVIPLLGNLL